MSNFMNIYGFELKKILSKKALWISLALVAVILLITTGSNFAETYKYPDGKAMKENEYYALARQKGELLSGKPIDEAFFEEIRTEVVQYALQAGYLTEEELQAVKDGTATEMMMNSAQTALLDAAEETGCANAFGLIMSMTDDIRRTMTISSDEWYETLKRNMEYPLEETSGAEKEYWQKSISSIKFPLIYYYAFGHFVFLSQMYSFGWLLLILLVISLAGLFADERSTRMDALILSAKNGRETIACAKLLAGITVGVGEALLMFLLNAAGSFLLYGAQGKDGALQLFLHGSAWNLTMGQAFWMFFVVTMFIGVFLSAFIMLLSELFSSMQVVVITMAFFLVSFFQLPDWLGIIAKLWELRPNVVLQYSTLNSSILFGGRFNIYETCIVVYLLTAIAFVTITGIIYKRSQVKSR